MKMGHIDEICIKDKNNLENITFLTKQQPG